MLEALSVLIVFSVCTALYEFTLRMMLNASDLSEEKGAIAETSD